MHHLISKLIVYRNIDKYSPIGKLAEIFGYRENKTFDDEQIRSLILDELYEIIKLGNLYGFESNLWTSYLIYLLATNENPFTLAAERKGIVNDTLKTFALNDFEIFIKLIHYDFSEIEKALNINCFTLIKNYKDIKESINGNLLSYNRHSVNNVATRIKELYEILKDEMDVNVFYEKLMSFYKKYGVGAFGLYKAFRVSVDARDTLLTPIAGTSDMTFDKLIGYEEQKKALIQNTEAFVNEKPANNTLLYGDAGTGKSSSIKSLLNMFYDKGLRMIEVYKYDYQYLPEILSKIKNRNYRFIIYLDDLSFEKNETEYKYLKAVIEGGLEVKPSNVLIYATSNRVHLLHETFSDRKEVETDDVHVNDSLTEQTSLASRFGLTLGYFDVRRNEFFDMILKLADRHKELVNVDRNELIKKAELWNMYHNDYSGRSAQQFIDDLLSKI